MGMAAKLDGGAPSYWRCGIPRKADWLRYANACLVRRFYPRSWILSTDIYQGSLMNFTRCVRFFRSRQGVSNDLNHRPWLLGIP